MKRRFLGVIALLAAMTISACYYPGTPAETKLYAPYCILKTNVPFADNLHTTQWDNVSILEADDYGRHYYSYKTYSKMLQCHIEIHVINQTETDNMQYSYYQDRCYMICRENETFSEEEIIQLKVDNDWGLPIVNEKLSYTDYETCNFRIAYDENVSLDLLEYLNLDDSYGVLSNPMESISDKAQLFFASVFSKQEGSDDSRYYLVVYQTDETQPIIACEEIPLTLKCQDSIRDFRESVLSQLSPNTD